jgi:GNAT superfamily N-acetyltransferase
MDHIREESHPSPRFTWVSQEEWLDDKQWWNIYLTSFPENERDTRYQINHALENNIAHVGCYKESHQTVAIALIYPLTSIPATYLHYLATDPSYRGKKLGSQLLQQLITESESINHRKHTQSLGLFWEVECPDNTTSEAEKTLRKNRIKFYEKNHAHLLKKTFTQPSVIPTNNLSEGETVVMRLMHATNNHQRIENEKFFSEALYMEKYHRINQTPQQLIAEFLQRHHG